MSYAPVNDSIYQSMVRKLTKNDCIVLMICAAVDMNEENSASVEVVRCPVFCKKPITPEMKQEIEKIADGVEELTNLMFESLVEEVEP